MQMPAPGAAHDRVEKEKEKKRKEGREREREREKRRAKIFNYGQKPWGRREEKRGEEILRE